MQNHQYSLYDNNISENSHKTIINFKLFQLSVETSSTTSETDIIWTFHFTFSSMYNLFADRINVVSDSLIFAERTTPSLPA